MHDLPAPDLYVEVGGGRRVAVDDRGDPDGVPVLFLHGAPDTRMGRHPDDTIAARLGVRLVAPDRPGLGHSDPDPAATPASVADDLVAVLDHLGLGAVSVVAWSAGSISALTLAGAHHRRVRSLVLVAPLVPADAYGEADVLVGADDSRRLFADHLGGADADELGRELAMWLVPPEIDDATARSMIPGTLAALAHVDGADRALVASLRASVAKGMTGIEREIAAQATPLGPALDAIAAPVAVHVGDHDTVAPPAMARWIAIRLGAPLAVHEGAGHELGITAWAEVLDAAIR
jgi:pimeloyl-ACP methyl ester carboxylesterase